MSNYSSTSYTNSTSSSSLSEIETETDTSSSYEFKEENTEKKSHSRRGRRKIGLKIFFLMCWIIFMLISFVLLFVIIFGQKKRENSSKVDYNKEIPLGLRYVYKEVDSLTGNENVHGTLFLESDRLIGTSNEVFVNDDKIFYIFNQLSNNGGSNKYDCTAQCICSGDRRFTAFVYPIFQTLFALSLTIATTMLVKNGIDKCKKYDATCDLDKNTAKCEERSENEGTLNFFSCNGMCLYDYSSEFLEEYPIAEKQNFKNFQNPDRIRVQAQNEQEAVRISYVPLRQKCKFTWIERIAPSIMLYQNPDLNYMDLNYMDISKDALEKIDCKSIECVIE